LFTDRSAIPTTDRLTPGLASWALFDKCKGDANATVAAGLGKSSCCCCDSCRDCGSCWVGLIPPASSVKLGGWLATKLPLFSILQVPMSPLFPFGCWNPMAKLESFFVFIRDS
jgi:hypothetical protein